MKLLSQLVSVFPLAFQVVRKPVLVLVGVFGCRDSRNALDIGPVKLRTDHRQLPSQFDTFCGAIRQSLLSIRKGRAKRRQVLFCHRCFRLRESAEVRANEYRESSRFGWMVVSLR
jgi:hypothetical protein